MAKKISKRTAKEWSTKFKGQGRGAKSVMFPKADVLAILNEPGCEGLRIYNAYDGDKKDPFTMFLVGTAADGSNLLPSSEESTSGQFSIMDDGHPCPPVCPPNDI